MYLLFLTCGYFVNIFNILQPYANNRSYFLSNDGPTPQRQQLRLIVGVAKLHGPARSLDLAILAETQRQLMLQTEELRQRVGVGTEARDDRLGVLKKD